MSKLYFVKYLPVEGEIKEGDCISDGITITKCVDIFGDFILTTAHASSVHKSTLKLAKLFLCSRDIQVGDEIRSTQDERIIIVSKIDKTDKHAFYYNENNVWFSDLDAFKVIGEISSDAIWVKNGDEFDEDEVRFMTGGYHALSHGEIEQNSCTEKEWLETKLSAWGIISKYIEIQCPTCKQYH